MFRYLLVVKMEKKTLDKWYLILQTGNYMCELLFNDPYSWCGKAGFNPVSYWCIYHIPCYDWQYFILKGLMSRKH